MKPACCKQFLHKRQRQSGSHCLILDLKTSNDLLLFMGFGTKDHILAAKQDIVSVPYFNAFEFLL